jgi:hypothetical protein
MCPPVFNGPQIRLAVAAVTLNIPVALFDFPLTGGKHQCGNGSGVRKRKRPNFKIGLSSCSLKYQPTISKLKYRKVYRYKYEVTVYDKHKNSRKE